MNRNIVTGLSNKELDELARNLDKWAEMMKKASINIVKDLSEYGLQRMQEIYAEAQSQYEDSTYMDFSITGSETEKTVSMSGPQALYDEFGTGTIGEQNPHPAKKEFGLNPYNDGSTIRKAKNEIINEETGEKIPAGELYWTYKDETGQVHHTQGIPAQKEGYDSLKDTIKKAPEIVKKRMEETLK